MYCAPPIIPQVPLSDYPAPIRADGYLQQPLHRESTYHPPSHVMQSPAPYPLPMAHSDAELQRKVMSVESKLDQLIHRTQLAPQPVYSVPASALSIPPPPVHPRGHYQVYSPSMVAHELYGTVLQSPHRPRVLPAGAVEVPPPPVLPAYVPARDRMDDVEASYAWLALRNLMRDLEEVEIRCRLRIMEEQVISAGHLKEDAAELHALYKESLAQERLAALDAEAMLRRHYANVARGETHRAVVSDDLIRTHHNRETSPDGRRGRDLLDRSRHPSPLREFATSTTRDERSATRFNKQQDLDDDASSLMRKGDIGPSPIPRAATTPYVATPFSFHREDHHTQFARSVPSRSATLPPVPTSPTRGGGHTNGASTVKGSTVERHRLSQIAKDMGADPITQREVLLAENVMTTSEYQTSRRRFKKALMEKALSQPL